MSNKSPHRHGRQLLVAVFTTLLVVSVSFVGTFYYFNLLNLRVFNEFERFTKSAHINAGISRELIGLELKIREMIPLILTTPAKLPQIRIDLLSDFANIKKVMAGVREPDNQRLTIDLEKYKRSLETMLLGYVDMNDAFLLIRKFSEGYLGELKSTEETIGQLMVEVAMTGRETIGIQQSYLLLPLCVEDFIQATLLIRSSISDNNPAILGVPGVGEGGAEERPSALAHLDTMEKTLGTITSSQEPIGEAASHLLADIVSFRQQIEQLYRIQLAMQDNAANFTAARDSLLLSLQSIDERSAEDIVSIRTQINRHGRQEFFISCVISGSILAVSLLGLLVARKMSRQLAETAEEAMITGEEILATNEQLQEEMHERQEIEEALRQSRDCLEQRVVERTAELSQANDLLQAEIEERLQMTKNLADERERLSVTLRSIGDGVISTDIDGRVTLINQNAELLTGWRQQEAIGRPLAEILPLFDAETRRPCEDPLVKVLHGREVVNLASHVLLVAKDGREFSITDSGAPIFDTQRHIIGVVLVFRDVSEQLRQKRELFNAQKMESIGTLAGGIAHDFNNILSAIIGYSDLALMRDSEESMTWREDLRQIRKAADRATALVRQILAFSRKQQLAKTPLQLSLIVKEAVKLIRAAIPTTIAIRQEINSEATVMADPTQMHQVIMNLCTNAYHAMLENGGVLAVCVGESIVSPEMSRTMDNLPMGRYLTLAVSDTGCGIEKEIRDKIFEPYFSTKEQGKGTGLGLAVVHGIVSSHGGRITVDSELGQGSTFTVYLPVVGTEVTSEEEKPIPPRARAHERVMVVDDEEAIRGIVCEFLSQVDYRPTAFANGLEAWGAFSAAPNDWDLLITDRTMPEMTGDQLVAKVIALRPELPIILCSGYRDRSAGNEPPEGKCYRYLQKPVDVRLLLVEVADALSGRSS